MSKFLTRRTVLHGLGALVAATNLPATAWTVTPSAEEILAATDRLRNPQESFRAQIKITEFVSGRVNDTLTITVYSKPRPSDGQFRSLVHIDKPRKDAGKIMLRDGKELFFFDPDASNTIRISPQQRLLGQASNGDVMTTNFGRDYAPRLNGRETIKDAARRDRDCYALKLRASNRAAIYGAIDFWVDSKTMHPVKGRFFSTSGRLLKIAFYSDLRRALGADRPTRVSIIDGLDTSKVSVMEFGRFAAVKLPDSWFQRSHLPRFQKP